MSLLQDIMPALDAHFTRRLSHSAPSLSWSTEAN
jgi:hypothetical protein